VGAQDDASAGVENELDLPFPLRPYQWQGVRFLIERDSALLADEMGLGKTVQVAVALSILVRTQAVRRILVVVPASLTLNWERELDRWAPTLSVRRVRGDTQDRLAYYRLPANVLVVSYDQLRLDAQTAAKELHPDLMVLDEAQRIKNASSRTSMACRALQRGRSWALTGTPLENSPGDLVAVFRFIRPGLIRTYMPIEELHQGIGPHFIRRMKADVYCELPPIIDQVISLELSSSQKRTYGYLWAERHGASNRGQMLALITKLKQVCNYDPNTGESSKLEALQTVVSGLTSKSDKIIVFSQYVETLIWLFERLAATMPAEIFYGGLLDYEKAAVLERFRTEPGPRLLLISLKAGGVGLNLQEATHVVLFDRWWNPAVEDQAIQRAHRFGRETVLHAIRFLVADSVEERIEAILREKKDLIDQYVNAAPSASVPNLSRNDLLRILGLDEPES